MANSKFLGDTKGNRDLNPCRDLDDKLGGRGESHKAASYSNEFLGKTKGNTDLPPDRTSGVKSGMGGGPHKAGGKGGY
jgi:hypothetical protein